MDLGKELRAILMKLRENQLINEQSLIDGLNQLETSSNVDDSTIARNLMVMIQISHSHNLLHELILKGEEVEHKIETFISSWEDKKLSNDEAREKISSLVKTKQSIEGKQESVKKGIDETLTNLRSIFENLGINPTTYFDLSRNQIQTMEEERVLTTFTKIWRKFLVEGGYETEKTQQRGKMPQFESDILNAFITPISSHNQIKFQLEEIIKPLPEIISEDTLFEKSKVIKEQEVDTHRREGPIVDRLLMDKPDLWDYVGNIVFTTSNKPLGLIRAPIQAQQHTFIPIVFEENVLFNEIKHKYLEILEIANVDANKITTEDFRSLIAETLEIPQQFSFQPSFVNEWLNLYSDNIIPLKPRISNIWFLNSKKFSFPQESPIIVNNDDFEKIKLSAWIPAPGLPPPFKLTRGMSISGVGGTHFGKIVGVIEKSPFGHSLLIKREIPPSNLMDHFLEGLERRNLAELRFYLSKKLKIGEGEVFSADSLWKVNFQERLLLSPHELGVAYYSIIPSAAFHEKNGLKAKIGIFFHPISESLLFLKGKSLYKDNNHFGTIYGFKIEEGLLYILFTPLTTDQLVQQIGRKHSEQQVDRFRKRISLALAVSPEESFLPNNLALYYLNFIFPMKEEFNSIKNSMSALESKFALNKLLFSKIKHFDENGMYI